MITFEQFKNFEKEFSDETPFYVFDYIYDFFEEGYITPQLKKYFCSGRNRTTAIERIKTFLSLDHERPEEKYKLFRFILKTERGDDVKGIYAEKLFLTKEECLSDLLSLQKEEIHEILLKIQGFYQNQDIIFDAFNQTLKEYKSYALVEDTHSNLFLLACEQENLQSFLPNTRYVYYEIYERKKGVDLSFCFTAHQPEGLMQHKKINVLRKNEKNKIISFLVERQSSFLENMIRSKNAVEHALQLCLDKG